MRLFNVHEGMGACYVVVIQKCFSGAVQLKCEGGCRLPGSSGEIESDLSATDYVASLES